MYMTEKEWLKMSEPTEADEMVGEAVDDVVDYANRIIEKAKAADNVDDLKSLHVLIEELGANLDEAINEIEALDYVPEYEPEYRMEY